MRIVHFTSCVAGPSGNSHAGAGQREWVVCSERKSGKPVWRLCEVAGIEQCVSERVLTGLICVQSAEKRHCQWVADGPSPTCLLGGSTRPFTHKRQGAPANRTFSSRPPSVGGSQAGKLSQPELPSHPGSTALLSQEPQTCTVVT